MREGNIGLKAGKGFLDYDSLDVNAHGPLRHPQPSGFIQLAGGQFHVQPLGVDVKNADARLALAANEVRLLNLSATAGDGKITGAGPDLRSRAAAAGDGIGGGASAGYWIRVVSTGEVRITRLDSR